MDKKTKADLGEIWETVRERLERVGVNLVDACCEAADEVEASGKRIKVVCVTPGLKDSVDALGKLARDQVVMVRVDEDTSRQLDAWVETGAVKSRSEAAALFIREGLKVRAEELEQLEEALGEVDRAKQKLRERARQVFGEDDDENATPADDTES